MRSAECGVRNWGGGIARVAWGVAVVAGVLLLGEVLAIPPAAGSDEASASEALMTPYGRYHDQISGIIEARWSLYLKEPGNDFGAGSMAVIKVALDATGKVLETKVTSNSGDPDYPAMCVKAIRDSQLPPVPAELASMMKDGKFWITFNFNIHLAVPPAAGTDGASPSEALMTPYGRYHHQISGIIGARWSLYLKEPGNDFGAGSMAVIKVALDATGKVVETKVASFSGDPDYPAMCVKAIRDSQLPPVPAELASMMKDGKFWITFNFNIYDPEKGPGRGRN